MSYTQMLFALTADKVVFGVSPSAMSWVGCVLILAGAIWVAAARVPESPDKLGNVEAGNGAADEALAGEGIGMGELSRKGKGKGRLAQVDEERVELMNTDEEKEEKEEKEEEEEEEKEEQDRAQAHGSLDILDEAVRDSAAQDRTQKGRTELLDSRT